MVRKVAEHLAGQAAVVQINTQENPSLAARYAIRGIPALLLLEKGQIVDRLGGAQSLEAVLAWFQQKS